MAQRIWLPSAPAESALSTCSRRRWTPECTPEGGNSLTVARGEPGYPPLLERPTPMHKVCVRLAPRARMYGESVALPHLQELAAHRLDHIGAAGPCPGGLYVAAAAVVQLHLKPAPADGEGMPFLPRLGRTGAGRRLPCRLPSSAHLEADGVPFSA
jgi:hypothetical protein